MDAMQTSDDFRDTVSSWSELAELVEHFSFFNGHDWLFRGVSDTAHGLIPKIGRKETRALKKDPNSGQRVRVPYRAEDERAVLTMFKQQAWPYMPTTPDGELQWLAIAQHHGLPTRLLDWTDGLLIAAWFAVEKGGAKESDSAIWVTKGVPQMPVDYQGEALTLAEPKSYRPTHINARITAQGSVFVICPNPTSELVLPFAKKITIRREAEFTLKKRLNACGINRRHLFPDLAGLSDHLSWAYKNDWLTGYRPRGSDPPTHDAADDTEA
jgi:hypothetical protein